MTKRALDTALRLVKPHAFTAVNYQPDRRPVNYVLYVTWKKRGKKRPKVLDLLLKADIAFNKLAGVRAALESRRFYDWPK